jgi:hypothetical protein
MGAAAGGCCATAVLARHTKAIANISRVDIVSFRFFMDFPSWQNWGTFAHNNISENPRKSPDIIRRKK